ncbi:unnamed protein product, partial [marine sediment metagenome]
MTEINIKKVVSEVYEFSCPYCSKVIKRTSKPMIDSASTKHIVHKHWDVMLKEGERNIKNSNAGVSSGVPIESSPEQSSEQPQEQSSELSPKSSPELSPELSPEQTP